MARRRRMARVRQGQSFKGRQFTAEVILWAVRWYLMFPISLCGSPEGAILSHRPRADDTACRGAEGAGLESSAPGRGTLNAAVGAVIRPCSAGRMPTPTVHLHSG